MHLPSRSVILKAVLLICLTRTLYNILTLVQPPKCEDEKLCIYSYLNRNVKLQLSIFTSSGGKGYLWYRNADFDYKNPFEKTLNLELPQETRDNGTLYGHIVVSPLPKTEWYQVTEDLETTYFTMWLTKYHIPNTNKVKLLENSSSVDTSMRPVTHVKKIISFMMLTDPVTFIQNELPKDIEIFMRLKSSIEYLPIIQENFMLERIEYLEELNISKPSVEVTLKYTPVTYGRFRIISYLDVACRFLIEQGIYEVGVDDIKSLSMDTNFYLLMTFLILRYVQILLDFLGIKNDTHFWRKRTNQESLSARAVIWNAFSELIILLFLIEEYASFLAIVPSFIALVTNVWEIRKVIPFDWQTLKFKPVTLTRTEQQTEEFDAQCVRYLSYVLYPLCIIVSIYSLLYDVHRSWYSWFIKNLTIGIYAFDFLFMLPQLFINYKLKSVTHLPRRTVVHKVFNSVVNDLFAIAVAMPIVYRLAFFLDDVIFLIYMYQRWLYPVDESRLEVDSEISVSEKEDVDVTKKQQ